MKHLLPAGLFVLMAHAALGQDAPTVFNGAGSFTRVFGMQPDLIDGVHRVSGVKFTNGKRVEGSAFFTDEMNKGYIVFFNDKKVTEVPLKYNDLNEELYFDDNGKEMILQTSFKEFGFTVVHENDTREFVFRNGFPPLENNTLQSFYQVLTGKNLILLKKTVKKVHEAKELNGMEFLRIRGTDTYYAYDVSAKKMYKLKLGLDGLTESLPNHKLQLETLAKSQKLRCRNEKEIMLLFSQL